MQIANKTPVTKDNEKGRENPGDVKSGGKKSPSQESDLLPNSRAIIPAVTSCSGPFSPPSCDLQFSKSHIRNSIYREKTCAKLGAEPQWLLALNTQVMIHPGHSQAHLKHFSFQKRWETGGMEVFLASS